MVKFTTKQVDLLDKAFDALANDRRRRIITSLSLQPLSISRLAEFQKLSLPAIHKHIKILESASLIHRRKVGRTNFLVLNHESFKQVQDWLMMHQTHWGSAKATLDNYDPTKLAQPRLLSNSRKDKKTG